MQLGLQRTQPSKKLPITALQHSWWAHRCCRHNSTLEQSPDNLGPPSTRPAVIGVHQTVNSPPAHVRYGAAGAGYDVILTADGVVIAQKLKQILQQPRIGLAVECSDGHRLPGAASMAS